MIETLKEEDGMYVDQDDVSHESKAEFLLIGVLGFCGCGDPEGSLRYVKEMLQLLADQEWRDYEDSAYIFFVQWANKEELAEHGCGIRCSWLTEKGKELLGDLIKIAPSSDRA